MFSKSELTTIINLFDSVKEDFHKEFSLEELMVYKKLLKIVEMLKLQNDFTTKQRKLSNEIREISEGKEN